MIFHVDMDAFFASVEQMDNPELKGLCVVVGGSSKRGVVAAASYEARKFGVYSAMPVFMARQKCPSLIIISPRMSRYKELSLKIMGVLNNFTPVVEPVSVDEAYLDLSGCERLYDSQVAAGMAIKKAIFKAVKLNSSVGIGPNKFLAKIASDFDKPDGLTIIRPEEVANFIESLPVRKVPGVGQKTCKELTLMNVRTLGDVKQLSPDILMQRLGKYGRRLFELSQGIDKSPVIPFSQTKSISSEVTLPENTTDKISLQKLLLKQAQEVGRQLRKHNFKAKIITIKLKNDKFKQITRRITLKSATQSSEIIYHEACCLLQNQQLTRKLRLIGLGASGLLPADTPVQIDLFGEPQAKQGKWQKVEKTVDSICDRFGKGTVKPGTLWNLTKKGDKL